jgi:KEOPS complex subunit Cgi121
LLKLFKEFGKYVLITGFRRVRIRDTDEFLRLIGAGKAPNVEVQIFDAEGVATWQHLYFAILNALTAFKNKTNKSKSLAMETMLYASAQRQIRKATEILGVKPGSPNVAVLIIGERTKDLESTLSKISKQIKAETDETVLELTNKKIANTQKIFGITKEELGAVTKERQTEKALTDLVIERMALLATER